VTNEKLFFGCIAIFRLILFLPKYWTNRLIGIQNLKKITTKGFWNDSNEGIECKQMEIYHLML